MTARSRHSAIVDQNMDPEQKGRIKVRCQTLAAFGEVLPWWIEPATMFSTNPSSNNAGTAGGIFFIPEVGTEVEIEVLDSTSDDELSGETFLSTPDARYYAAPFSSGKDVPAEFLTNYPKRGGIKTAAGHYIMFDNTEGQETVQIVGKFGKGSTTTIIKLTKDSILVTNSTAVMVVDVAEMDIGAGADTHIPRGEDLLTAINAAITIFNAHVMNFIGVPPGVPAVTLVTATPMTPITSAVLSPKHKVK